MSCRNLPRHDPILIKVVEELKCKADGDGAELAIVEIEGNRYYIHKYDGAEWVDTPETMDWIEIGESK